MIALPIVTHDEYALLMRCLGVSGSQGVKTLGIGLTGEGVIALRHKFELADDTLTPDMAMVRIEQGMDERITIPGQWTAYMHDGQPVVEYHDVA